MSTNYYWRFNGCHCCERYDEVHIGKSSGGWEFCFRGYRSSSTSTEKDTVSWDDWKTRFSMEEGTIFDEYGSPVPLADFIELVEQHTAPGATWGGSGRPLLNHIDEILADRKYESSWPDYRNPARHWKDNRGYSFSIGEFS
jgi:hypothetical protein